MVCFEDFSLNIWALGKDIRRVLNRIIMPILQKEDLSLMQVYAMGGIETGQINNISTLCEMLDMSQGNASSLSKRLELLGCITRVRSKEDERVVNLVITQKGSEKLQNIKQRFEGLMPTLKEIPEEEFHTIEAGLAALSNVLIKLHEVSSAQMD